MQPPAMPPPHGPGHTPPGMMPPPVSVQGGMHPSIASEAFRPKVPMGDHRPHQLHPHQHLQHPNMLPFASPPTGRVRQHTIPPQQPMPQQFFRHPMQTHQPRRGLDDNESAFLPEPLPPPTLRAVAVGASPQTHEEDQKRMAQPSYEQDDNDNTDLHSRESEVEYVLAKQYKALRTEERLGFPAYSASREILGFYRESRSKVGVGEFVPISRHAQDFGPLEIMQASEILEDAIAKKSSAVHALKDWGSIANLIDHALVYDWTKDIGSSGGPGNSQSGSEAE